MLNRLDARIDYRILVREQAAPIAALTQHVPALLNAISAQNAAARELRRAELRLDSALGELRDAVAALRGEVADLSDEQREGLDGRMDGGEVSRFIAAP